MICLDIGSCEMPRSLMISVTGMLWQQRTSRRSHYYAEKKWLFCLKLSLNSILEIGSVCIFIGICTRFPKALATVTLLVIGRIEGRPSVSRLWSRNAGHFYKDRKRCRKGTERAGSASVKVLWSLLTVLVSATLRRALLLLFPFSTWKLLGLFHTFLLNYYNTVLGLFLFHLEAFL